MASETELLINNLVDTAARAAVANCGLVIDVTGGEKANAYRAARTKLSTHVQQIEAELARIRQRPSAKLLEAIREVHICGGPGGDDIVMAAGDWSELCSLAARTEQEAEDDAPSLQKELKRSCQQWSDRCAELEAELAALKARLDGAARLTVGGHYPVLFKKLTGVAPPRDDYTMTLLVLPAEEPSSPGKPDNCPHDMQPDRNGFTCAKCGYSSRLPDVPETCEVPDEESEKTDD